LLQLPAKFYGNSLTISKVVEINFWLNFCGLRVDYDDINGSVVSFDNDFQSE